MKQLSIAVVLALVALSGVGTAWSYNDTPTTGPDAVSTVTVTQRTVGR